MWTTAKHTRKESEWVTIRSVKARVNTFGTVKKVFKNISKAGKYTLVARYLGSPTLESSVHRAKLVV